jgi:hypothetical protein
VILATAGHRPANLSLDTHLWVRHEVSRVVAQLDPELTLTGLNPGTDLWIAEAVLTLGNPLAVYLPFPKLEAQWYGPATHRYQAVLDRADAVYVLDDTQPVNGSDAIRKMNVRNGALVGDADHVYLVWNGRLGNTSAVLRLALAAGHPLTVTDPSRRVTRLLGATSRDRLAIRLGVPTLVPDPVTTSAA